MGFVEVAKWSELSENTCIAKTVGVISILLCRKNDELYALENQCPHAGSKLSGGCFEGYVIECPAHGHKFDVRSDFPLKMLMVFQFLVLVRMCVVDQYG